jgi:hypothetical protein
VARLGGMGQCQSSAHDRVVVSMGAWASVVGGRFGGVFGIGGGGINARGDCTGQPAESHKRPRAAPDCHWRSEAAVLGRRKGGGGAMWGKGSGGGLG